MPRLVVHSSILVLSAGLGHRGRPQENPDIDPTHARGDGGAHRVTRGLQYMRLWVLSGTYPTRRWRALPRTWRRGVSPCRLARARPHQGPCLPRPARPPPILRPPLPPRPPCQAPPRPPCRRLRQLLRLLRRPPGRRRPPLPPPPAAAGRRERNFSAHPAALAAERSPGNAATTQQRTTPISASFWRGRGHRPMAQGVDPRLAVYGRS